MFEEGPALVGEKRLGRAHAARGPAGEDDGGQHVCLSASPWRVVHGMVSAGRTSIFSFLCSPCAAFRRTATSSATMLTAISSGESAPISSPIGAYTRSNSSGL